MPETSAASTAVPRPGFLGVAGAFLRRDLVEAASYRLAFLLRFFSFAVGLLTVYFTARFVNLARNPLLAPYGGDYFAFSLTGLIFIDFQYVAIGAFATRIRQAQTLGTLEAVLATPTPLPTILAASPIYDFAAAALRAALYLVCGALVFGVRLHQANLPALLVTAVLALATFVSLGLCAGAFTLLLRRGDPINLLLGGASMLLGGVWYPAQALPGWLARVGDLLPLTHGLEATRRALLSGATIGDLARPLGWLLAQCLVFAPAGLLLFALALRRARQDGSLTHY